MGYSRPLRPVQTAAPAVAGPKAGLPSAPIAAKAFAFVTFVMRSAERAGFASFAMAVFN